MKNTLDSVALNNQQDVSSILFLVAFLSFLCTCYSVFTFKLIDSWFSFIFYILIFQTSHWIKNQLWLKSLVLIHYLENHVSLYLRQTSKITHNRNENFFCHLMMLILPVDAILGIWNLFHPSLNKNLLFRRLAHEPFLYLFHSLPWFFSWKIVL